MDHGRLEEAVASYALGAIDDADRREIEGVLLDHLPGCDSCRRMLADFREVVGDLALVAGAQRVPDAVEREIMERVRGERPVAAATTPPGVGPRWWTRGAVAAAFVAIGSLGAWNLQLASRVSDARADNEAVVRALALIGSPDAKTVRLGGSGSGTMLFAHRPGEAVLVARGMAAAPAGHVLQLWLMSAGSPVSAGVLEPHDGLAVLALGSGAEGYDAVAVTVEKAPGTLRPSGAPIFTASLTG